MASGISNFEFRMKNSELPIRNSKFEILHSLTDPLAHQFRILRSFGVFAPQDEATRASFVRRQRDANLSGHPLVRAAHLPVDRVPCSRADVLAATEGFAHELGIDPGVV